MRNLNRERLDHLKSLSVVFDSKFQGPFGYRFGLDGILGLVPFLGDFVTSGVSIYIIVHAAALGCTPATITRMALNVLIENIFDMIPFLGNFFDFFWKANNKNIALLEDHLMNPRKVTLQSRIILIIVCVLLIGILILSGYLTWQALSFLYDWISAQGARF